MASPLGSAPGIIVGVGVGTAAATALEPAIELARQNAWKGNQNRLLDPGTMARLVAQGGISLEAAHQSGEREGYSDDKVNALVYLAQTVPGFGEALALYRREPVKFADLWTHALTKAGLDARYLPPLNELVDDRLSPPVVALAIVRGIMEDPGFLPVGPPTTEGKVRAFPTSPLDPLEEARAFGFGKERLFVQTAISGRPMGPEGAAAATFKKILERVDFDRAISEGDVRNEWADAIFENARPIPHPLDYVQAHLRGWRTEPEMYAGAQRSGMHDTDTDLLFLIHGRPPSAHQVFIGLRRGGVYDGPVDMIDPAFLKAMRESDIRPEWYNLLWFGRETLPAPFVNRALTEGGDLSQEESYGILHDEGWPLALADKVSKRWAAKAGTGAKSDPHVGKAQTSLFTALHRSYVNRESGANEVTPGLTALGLDAAAQAAVLALWDTERALIHAELSPTQIRKAINAAIVNPSTNAPWSHADGIAALLARGYSQADAETFLAE